MLHALRKTTTTKIKTWDKEKAVNDTEMKAYETHSTVFVIVLILSACSLPVCLISFFVFGAIYQGTGMKKKLSVSSLYVNNGCYCYTIFAVNFCF